MMLLSNSCVFSNLIAAGEGGGNTDVCPEAAIHLRINDTAFVDLLKRYSHFTVMGASPEDFQSLVMLKLLILSRN